MSSIPTKLAGVARSPTREIPPGPRRWCRWQRGRLSREQGRQFPVAGCSSPAVYRRWVTGSLEVSKGLTLMRSRPSAAIATFYSLRHAATLLTAFMTFGVASLAN